MEIRIINMRDTRRFPYVENKLAAILLFIFFISLMEIRITNMRETCLFPAQERFGPVRPKGIETLCA
jgi:hypothetical protein